MQRRWIQIIAMLAVLLVGCGGPAAPVPTVTVETQAAVPTPTLVAGPVDTLRWSLEGITDLTSLDPAKPVNLASTTVINLVFSGLIRLDEHLEVQPDNAESWQTSADGKTYTFTLRDNLMFADGTPVTAQDFADSINRALAPATASYGAPFQLGHIVGAQEVIAGTTTEATGVRALDDRTLEIELDEPQAYFLSQLAYTYTFVVPRSLIESGPDWQERAYGTGPYRVAEWRHGESITLQANERYWRGRPGFAAVVLPFFADSNDAVEEYLKGNLDIVGGQQNPLPAEQVSRVQARAGFRSSASLVTRYVGFNNARPPFNDVRMRRAFALATDKDALVTDVLRGTVVKANRILPTGLLGTELPLRPLMFDAAAAAQELAAAGYQPATVPPITLAYAEEGDNALVARNLQQSWQQHLGVQVDLQGYPIDVFNRQLDTTYFTPTAGLDLYLSVWGADYPDPQNFISQQLRTGSPNNNGHFSDAEFDRLVDRADRLGAADQLDLRLQLYNQAEQIAIDQVGWLPLYYPTFNMLLRPDVRGVQITPTGLVIPDWSQVRRAAP